MIERDLSDILRETKESRPHWFRTVNYTCGHQRDWYVGPSWGAPDEDWLVLDEEGLQSEKGQLCPACRPCSECASAPCVCVFPDPFADA